MKKISVKRKIIEGEKVYKLVLIKNGFAYYVDEKEEDENNSTIMTTVEGKYISKSIFAYNDFMEAMEEVVSDFEYCDYIDKELKTQAEKYFSEC